MGNFDFIIFEWENQRQLISGLYYYEHLSKNLSNNVSKI
ncbi:hypothetical protein NU08_0856 [Flavobacterium anhuiense]|uniref:Uncharacterized protein n=1 Tax=Flavobacterium anhuiense TaxID=459526 RepID=A0A444W2I0_9FLAO|nr:hypothetical protein NU08_0856 [Flavobacterium anhuiense]